jgi:hypothetical protein
LRLEERHHLEVDRKILIHAHRVLREIDAAHQGESPRVFCTMSNADSALSSTPTGSHPSSSCHTRIPECATTDLDSPKYEAGQTFTDGLEPWLSAWLAVGQENH